MTALHDYFIINQNSTRYKQYKYQSDKATIIYLFCLGNPTNV